MKAKDKLSKITIADIATEAGVSKGLVSTFLNGVKPGAKSANGIRIGKETAERIREAACALNYRPANSLAFSQIYPEQAEICLMSERGDLGLQSSGYFAAILHGVLTAASRVGCKLSIAQFDGSVDYRKTTDLPVGVQDPGITKFILARNPNLSLVRTLLKAEKQVVYLSREIELPGVASIVPDYRSAATIALNHLVRLGHQRIGILVGGHLRDSYPARELRAGLKDAVQRRSLESFGELFDPETEKVSMAIGIDRILAREPRPTALFAFDDYTAEQAMELLGNRGISIPEEMSLIGCGDDRKLDPPISTIHFPSSDLGIGAVELVNRMALDPDEDFQKRVVLPVHLVERASCGTAIRGSF